jgi:hypothetical protein
MCAVGYFFSDFGEKYEFTVSRGRDPIDRLVSNIKPVQSSEIESFKFSGIVEDVKLHEIQLASPLYDLSTYVAPYFLDFDRKHHASVFHSNILPLFSYLFAYLSSLYFPSLFSV